MDEKSFARVKGDKKMMIWIVAGIAVLAFLGIVLFTGKRNIVHKIRSFTVGKDITADDIDDFYYTLSTSTDPPHFQRYRFYAEDGKYFFYHEKREGDHFPLRERDITVSGSVELTKEEWQDFVGLLSGGIVKAREESTETGGSGPWTYLYWKKDKSVYQEYSFPSYGDRVRFEEYCTELAGRQ